MQVEGGNFRDRPQIQKLRISFRALRLIVNHRWNVVRSALLGTGLGAGCDVSAFVAYAVAKRLAAAEEGYGEGAEGGVVAFEQRPELAA